MLYFNSSSDRPNTVSSANVQGSVLVANRRSFQYASLLAQTLEFHDLEYSPEMSRRPILVLIPGPSGKPRRDNRTRFGTKRLTPKQHQVEWTRDQARLSVYPWLCSYLLFLVQVPYAVFTLTALRGSSYYKTSYFRKLISIIYYNFP